MTHLSQLIDSISTELKAIQLQAENLAEHYSNLSALLISARTLVPEDRWDAWLVGNLDLNEDEAAVLIRNAFNDEPPKFPGVTLNGSDINLSGNGASTAASAKGNKKNRAARSRF